nr:unnamed protein product [Callosobruchus chinensis]
MRLCDILLIRSSPDLEEKERESERERDLFSLKVKLLLEAEFTGIKVKARKYSSPSNLLTLYKAQIRPSLEYCSHIWGAPAPTALSILDAVQRKSIRLCDPALTCHLQPLSHRHAVSDLSLFYRYSNGFYSSPAELLLNPRRSFCPQGV